MSEAQKIKAIYDLVYEMHGDMKLIKLQQEQQAKAIEEQDKKIEGIVADRNKVVGVMWLGAALGGITGIGAFILSVIKH